MPVIPTTEDLAMQLESSDEIVYPSLRMTEAEFQEFATSGVRAEWVDGEVVFMAPVSLIHIRLNNWILRVLGEFLDRKPLGEAMGPEFTIRLGEQRRLRVPDLLFVANDRRHLLMKSYLEGAPDLSVEVISPDSQSRDRRDKFIEYEQAGVREYWIVDPLSQTIEAYTLNATAAFELIKPVDGKIASRVLPEFYLKPQWLWQDPLPKVADILREMGLPL